jgi:hypothetical protein
MIFFLIGLTKGSQSFGADLNWFRMAKNDSHYARLTSSVYPIVNCTLATPRLRRLSIGRAKAAEIMQRMRAMARR